MGRFRFTSWSLRASSCALLLAALLALAGAPAPAALAASIGGGEALSELTKGSEAETTATTTATKSSTASSEPHDSKTVLVLGLAGAAVLLAGIAFVIMRDVRKVAPATTGEMLETGSTRRSEAAMRKRRAKAKAARQQRKRNR
ncbi:MAG: hypothetical protein ACLQBY_03425 [Solirubrobacteraceae bacterium]